MEETENVEDTEVSETTTQCQSTLSLNSEIEDAEAQTTKRKPTEVIGETTKRRRTPLNPEFGEDAEASETSKLLSKPVDGDAYGKIPLAFASPEVYQAVAESAPPDVRAKSEKEIAAYVNKMIMRYAPSQKENMDENMGNGSRNDGSSEESSLRLEPCLEHKADNYEDLEEELEFDPLLYSSLERYLPDNLLNSSRLVKAQYMNEILLGYSPPSERDHTHKHREYRQKITSNYQPLHKVLYTMHPTNFFVPSFLKAISESTEESFRNIMSEPSPGVLTFEMLQPRFCEMMLEEVENFEKWIRETKFRIMRPNSMNKYGAVLDDFGLQTMLQKFMEDFIRPISKVLFTEVGGSTLDSHHGFVVEYGTDRDVDLGFHVDDAEVTLNVCLGKQFDGGELFFRGVRCEKHVNTKTQPEEMFDYSHVAGHAILHCGRHRHGARATTSGRRTNLILWCRSSMFREMRKYQTDFSSWCAECKREKEERIRKNVLFLKSEMRLRIL